MTFFWVEVAPSTVLFSTVFSILFLNFLISIVTQRKQQMFDIKEISFKHLPLEKKNILLRVKEEAARLNEGSRPCNENEEFINTYKEEAHLFKMILNYILDYPSVITEGPDSSFDLWVKWCNRHIDHRKREIQHEIAAMRARN